MTEMRLQRLLGRAGVASRRHAETLIAEGRVAVNGTVVRTPGQKADPERDEVTVDGRRVGPPEEAATILLHKPAAVLSTLSDPQGRETVKQLVAAESLHFRPVGRLDYHTEGLLLLTTDGELLHRLLHPRYEVPKVYVAKVRGRPKPRTVAQWADGVRLEDGRTRPSSVEVLEATERATWLQFVVTEGRNRLIRRMCEHLHHPVLRLMRTEFATLELGTLRPGQYRYLEPRELVLLHRAAGLARAPELPSGAEAQLGRRLGTARRRKAALPGEKRRVSAPPSRKSAKRGRTRTDERPTREGTKRVPGTTKNSARGLKRSADGAPRSEKEPKRDGRKKTRQTAETKEARTAQGSKRARGQTSLRKARRATKQTAGAPKRTRGPQGTGRPHKGSGTEGRASKRKTQKRTTAKTPNRRPKKKTTHRLGRPKR